MSDRDLKPLSPENEAEEQKNSRQVIAAFKYYSAYSHMRVNKTEAYLNSLPTEHQDMLARYRDHLTRIRDCIDQNARVIRMMIRNVDLMFESSPMTPTKTVNQEDGHIVKIRSQDLEAAVDPFKSLKVQITLKQFARDWSIEGESERRQCYTPIIDEIVQYYNPEEVDVSKVKVLVPGAGLGRLTYELAYRGYYCEGNEFSLFMLIASNFVLNKCEIENQYTIYPWIHQWVNNLTRNDQIVPITFPDVSPCEAPPKGTFTMVAGDFLKVYTQPDYWDCVATCFFIDCANNVIQFVETIFRILKPGGIWVNLGPLLYHYSDVQDELSIEPTFEDLIGIINTVGFQILKSQTEVTTKYAQNPRSMQQSSYQSVFFVCKKPDELESQIPAHPYD